jgi:hypothetical protein
MPAANQVQYFQVDAFTERPFSGNAAGVFLLEEEMDPRAMQLLARETNLSETAFVAPADASGLREVRWFTPAVEGLSEACRILVRVVDRPPERIVVGQCPCGEYLYAIRAAPAVTCRSCGASYDVDATRAMLRRQLGQTLMTAAEIATLATYLGLTGSRGTTRKLINQWASRGLIAAHGSYHVDDEDQADEDGVAGLFRFGDVIERLAVSRRRVDHGPATVTGV